MYVNEGVEIKHNEDSEERYILLLAVPLCVFIYIEVANPFPFLAHCFNGKAMRGGWGRKALH